MNSDPLDCVLVENLALNQVDFSPIIRAYMQRLGLVDLINQLVVTDMDVEPGIILAEAGPFCIILKIFRSG